MVSFFAFSQSKIQQSKKDLKQKTTATSTTSSAQSSTRNSSRNSARASNNTIFEDVVGIVFFGIFKYVIIGSPRLEDHLNNKLTNFPYQNGAVGNYVSVSENDDKAKTKNFRFDLENNFLMSNQSLYGNHLRAKIRPFQYFYLQGDAHNLFEKNQQINRTEQLNLFGINVGYDRIRFEKFNFGFTLGLNYIGSDVNKVGASFGLCSEAFLGNKTSISAAAKWGEINGQALDLFEVRGKYHFKKMFASAGFEHLKIGSPNYNFVTIGGGIYLN